MWCGSMFGGGTPDTPKPVVTAAPAATSVGKNVESSTEKARLDAEKQRKKQSGAKQTSVTGTEGLGAESVQSLGAKKLLGS